MSMEPIDTDAFFTGLDCPYCGVNILPAYDPQAADEPLAAEAPCEHVFMIGMDMGISFLSADAKQALVAAGVFVDDTLDDLIEILDEDRWAAFGRSITWPGAQILATYAPRPSIAGTYVGVRP